jgi:hypothetical protein
MLIDGNGRPLREGASVRLLRAPPELLNGLPDEDQRAIKWAAEGAALKMVGCDEYGNIELMFKAPDGVRHWIFVQPQHVVTIQ